MKPIKISEIAAAVGTAYSTEGMVTSICTDSREAGPGTLFVAIPGERVDGHSYVRPALEQGAAAALVEREGDYPTEKILRVENTVEALLHLAAWYRTTMSPHVVGVTGSVGKTTTKEMIAAVLSAGFKTIKTQGNQNNEIGAPRTILSIDSDTQAAVIEMGMSGFGEIRALALAARPEIGVITNIGVSHMEHLGSRENILKAKLELAECLPEGALLLLCADNDLLKGVKIPRLRVLFYGVDTPEAALRGTITHTDAQSTAFTICWRGASWQARIPGTGKHLVQNALAAFAVGMELGIAPEAAIAALAAYQPSGMRQKLVDCHGITVVEDCYNASPDSVAAALRALKEFPCTGRRVVVLSDMLELGALAHQGHRDCGELAARCGVDALLLYGDYAQDYAQGAQAAGLGAVELFSRKEELAPRLAELLSPGDMVWFKASRGMKLEEAIEQLYTLL